MMRGSVFVSAFSACLTLAGCGGRNVRLSDRGRSEAITHLATSIVAHRGVPGIAIAVLRGGRVFQTVTLGVSDLASRQPVSGSTPFQLSSTTKVFSSVGVLLLVADGKVRLDEPIGDYVSELPTAWRGVTIRQLLSHTSGLPDITRRTGELDLVADDWDTALSIVANRPFQFRPGSDWAYTQTNYMLLQRLVAQVSGLTFEEFLERRLFLPLGMRHTFFPDPQHASAVNYEREQDGRIVERTELSFPRYVHAAGGLCSSLDDLIAWSGALESGKIISRELLETARTPTKLANGSTARISGPMSYGLGWAVDTTPGHRWAGHSGGNSTALRQYLDDGITIIVLHNGTSDPDAIASSLARSMLEETSGGGAQADLWDAAVNGDLAAAEAALQEGADVNALDTRSSHNGRYALNWAAINNRVDIIRFLLRHGAAIDARNRTGFTALHHAAESGSIDAARVLLAAGANASLRNSNGEVPSDLARRRGHIPVARLIDAARHGAQ